MSGTFSVVAISVLEIVLKMIIILKKSFGMQSNVTTGNPLQKPSLLRGRIMKVTGQKIIFIIFKLKTSRFLFLQLVVHTTILPATQKLICKDLEIKITNHCLTFKEVELHLITVSNEHVQLHYDEPAHWLLNFCSNSRIQICDSYKTSMSLIMKKSVYALDKNCGCQLSSLP